MTVTRPGLARARPAPLQPERGLQWTSTTGHLLVRALVLCGAGLMVSAVVDLADRGDAALPLGAWGLLVGAAGMIGRRQVRLPARIGTGTVLAAVAATAAVIALVSAVAYLLAGTFARFDDALFESVSGLTTTGLTVLRDLEGTPDGVLLWRALTQWIGGFGAIVVVVAVVPLFGAGGLELVGSEETGRSAASLAPRVAKATRRLAQVYAVMTAAIAVAYLVAGMPVFDAASYALTTASTGGFANHPGSLAFFGSDAIEWITVAGMLAAGANFALYLRALRGGTGSVLRSLELRAYALVIAGASVLAVVWTADGGADSVRHAIFAVVAVVTTTGHSVADWGEWIVGAQVLLLLLMGVGAMSGSTGGGFRILRALAMLAYIRRELVRQLHPRSVSVVKLGRQPLSEVLLSRIVGYAALYLLVAALGAVGVAALGTELVGAVSISISALSTVGPGLGDVGPSGDALALTAPARGVLMVVMLAGRLEIYPVLAAGAVLTGMVSSPIGALRRRLRSQLRR